MPPPGAKALSAVTSGPTGRFARASAGLPSQDSGFRPPDRMAASDRKAKIPDHLVSFYAVSIKDDYKYFYYIYGSARILGVF